MLLFGMDLFAQSVLEWHIGTCCNEECCPLGCLPYLAPYTWGWRLFLYSLQCEVGAIVKLNPSKSWQGRWLLWVCASSVR